mmetsp:Transcript_10390/g.44206  ORF Transcript_10390/g.44206 Transcript_10390/m.44206 type:complete len:339 (-) Transcript_10390:685-1701(-)
MPYFSPSVFVSRSAYFLNAAVMASRSFASSLGRYMMIPIQLCNPGAPAPTAFEPSHATLVAGDMGEALPADHLCSMGAGAGMPSVSIISSSSAMYSKSAPVLVSTESPVRNATSYTCCCPPQSNPRILSLQSHRRPELRRQNSASAAFTRLTCSRSSGATFKSSSRSCPNPMSALSTSGAHCWSSRRMGSVFFRARSGVSSATTGGSAPSGRGFEPTTTTQSVCGIHMYRMCWWPASHCLCFLRTSARDAVQVFSRSRCALVTRIVTSAATPSAPTPQRATRSASPPSGSDRLKVISPFAGVMSFSLVTVSSNGGTVAPVPCAPTCVKPPICCSRMDA